MVLVSVGDLLIRNKLCVGALCRQCGQGGCC